MNYKYLFILIIVFCLFFSLISLGKISGNKTKTESISVINKDSNKSGAVGSDDDSSAIFAKNVSDSPVSLQPTTRTISDGSTINTTFDRLGNKTEIRKFNSHPRLGLVILNTTDGGRRQVFVYGLNGQVRPLPENMLDKVMTASAEEIADSAGVYISTEKPLPSPNFAQMNNQPTSAPPIQMRPLNPLPPETQSIEPVAAEEEKTEEAKTANDDAEKKTASAEKDARPKESKETITLNRQPEHE